MSPATPVIDASQYQSYHIQGSLLKSRILYIHVNHGTAAIKQVLATLPAEAQKALSAIYVGEWYPLSLLVMIDRAIVEGLGAGNEHVYQELGAFSADMNLNNAYEPLAHKSVHAFLELTAVLHKTYQDFGEATYLRISDTGALLQFRYPSPPPEFYCRSGMGYIQHAIELCGGKYVSVRITACQRLGDPLCEFRVEWKE